MATQVIAVYNNKGGVGKSTVTVLLAELIAARLRRPVLVLDLDNQASSARALLGQERLHEAVVTGRTAGALAQRLRRARRVIDTPEDFFVRRPGVPGRGYVAMDLDILVADRTSTLEFERKATTRDRLLFRRLLSPALKHYPYVIIDLPANIDERNTLAVNGLAMAERVLIPLEPTRIAVHALPDTLEMVETVADWNKDGTPSVLGILLNKANKNTQQFGSTVPILQAEVKGRRLPPILKHRLPNSTRLATATDDARTFKRVQERFQSAYEGGRKVVREVESMCTTPSRRFPPSLANRLRTALLGPRRR